MSKNLDLKAINWTYILYGIIFILAYLFLFNKYENKHVDLFLMASLLCILGFGIFTLPLATKNLSVYKKRRINVIVFVLTELIITYAFVLSVLFAIVFCLSLFSSTNEAYIIKISVVGTAILTLFLWHLLSKYVVQKWAYYREFYAYKRALEKHFDFSILATVFTVIVTIFTFDYNSGASDSSPADVLMAYTFSATLFVYTIKHGFRKVFQDKDEKMERVNRDYENALKSGKTEK